MIIDRRLLTIIGRRFPAVYDVSPRGPLNQFSNVALNPQPLPPHELGAALANEFARTTWLVVRLNLDPASLFDDLDDWCPTPPKPPKLPPWWTPLPEPEPQPEWFVDLHLGFAARLAVASADHEGTALAEVFDKAIDRSLTAIQELNG